MCERERNRLWSARTIGVVIIGEVEANNLINKIQQFLSLELSCITGFNQGAHVPTVFDGEGVGW